MTTIDVDTSPLQAAREWRGIGLVAAALGSGLPVAQAEALEGGTSDAFDSTEEMIAAAVVYGASLGIGREEAVALLDRTVTRSTLHVELPAAGGAAASDRAAGSFASAVRERSARISGTPEASELVTTALVDVPRSARPVVAPLIDDLHTGPTPDQAVAASSELQLDEIEAGLAPWERADSTGELEAWVADDGPFGDDDRHTVGVASRGEQVRGAVAPVLERVLGEERSDRVAAWLGDAVDRVSHAVRAGRDRLGRSEHATLVIAIGAGALLIALLVAVGGALGRDDEQAPAGPGPELRTPGAVADPATAPSGTTTSTGREADVEAGASAVASATASDAAAAKPGPVVAPAKLRVNVYNSGGAKGAARSVAAKLDGLGYGIGQVQNARGDYPGATIIHPAGMEREARLLARHTGITTLQLSPGTSKDITVVVA